MSGAGPVMADDQDNRSLRERAAGLEAELERLKRQLAEAHQFAAIGRLMAGIVHEINTPIGSIFSNNQVMLRSLENVRKGLASPEPDLPENLVPLTKNPMGAQALPLLVALARGTPAGLVLRAGARSSLRIGITP